MKIDKQQILSDIINGNWSDAKKSVRRLNKSELMDLIRYVAEQTGTLEGAVNDISKLV